MLLSHVNAIVTFFMKTAFWDHARLMLRVSALSGGTAHQLALPANTQLASIYL